ncbi:metal-dependent phosphohydrolase, partial [Streptomyces sp. AA8]|nr:metal-dependent phosphohydrolase [Streptomyces telluris]
MLIRSVHAAAVALSLAALARTAWHGVAQPRVALAYALLIAVGEAARRRRPTTGPGDRQTAPVGAAGALSYALLGEIGGRPTAHCAPQVVAVVLAATLAGAVGRPPTRDHLARRLLTT